MQFTQAFHQTLTQLQASHVFCALIRADSGDRLLDYFKPGT
ncbi:MAG TPA: hypothetical protein V6D10_13955 [Trichocoleus sp.]